MLIVEDDRATHRVPEAFWRYMTTSDIRIAIEGLSRLLAEQPAKARSRSPAATATLESGLGCTVQGPHGERLQTDMPPALGGTGSAPNPGWLLRAAIASCTATVIATRAAQLGVDLQTLEVTVDSESDVRGMLGFDESVPAGLFGFRMQVRIGAPGQTPERLREIAAWANRHSPVGCALDPAGVPELGVEVVDAPATIPG